MKTELENMTPWDVPALWELCREQNEIDGTDYAPPRIFDEHDRLMPNIPLALKAVRGGRIIQGHVFELTPELQTFGLDARATLNCLKELPAAMYLLEKMGHTGFRALVPMARLDLWMENFGARLRMQRDDKLAHFYRSFRETSR